MNETIKSLEVERKKVYKNYLICTILGCIFIPLDFIIIFIMTAFEEESLYEIIVMISMGLMICGIILIASAQIMKRKYLATAKGKIINNLLVQVLGNDFVYNPNGGISLSSILSQGIYKYPDRYFLEDYISSKFNGVPYEMCDCTLQEKHETRDKDGRKKVSYVTYFKGRVIKIDYKRDFDFNMRVIETKSKFYNYNFKLMYDIETEVIEFNKKFNTYADDKEKAYYFLTPVLIQKMLELEKLFKGTINYSIDGDYFFIYINDSGNSLEVKLSKSLDKEQLDVICSEINLAATIINEFRLDSQKFNENIEI